jgi:hypothetical protein
MPLQRFTMGHMPDLAKVVHGTIAMLRFLGVVAVPRPLLHHVAWVNDHATSHSSEQASHPIPSLISKQVVPYRIRGGTCCPVVSTSKIWFLADSSMTNHNT